MTRSSGVFRVSQLGCIMNDKASHALAWMKTCLLAAGIYNLTWGAAVILFPNAIFNFAAMELPTYPQIWQCVGMIVGVYGIGYLVAARDPFRHWPIVLVGFLGKVFGPIGFLQAAFVGDLPWRWGITILTNDLIWWLPFSAMLYGAFRFHSDTSRGIADRKFDAVIQDCESQRGVSLAELSSKQPVIVVFVRHQGCTFCREALADLAKQSSELNSREIEIAVVHMSSPMDATILFERYGLTGVHRYSDPHCEIYRSFGLTRGKIFQVFAAKVWRRALLDGVLFRFGWGKLKGDGFRMPGTFLLLDGRVVARKLAETAADRPDYASWANEELKKVDNQSVDSIQHPETVIAV